MGMYEQISIALLVPATILYSLACVSHSWFQLPGVSYGLWVAKYCDYLSCHIIPAFFTEEPGINIICVERLLVSFTSVVCHPRAVWWCMWHSIFWLYHLHFVTWEPFCSITKKLILRQLTSKFGILYFFYPYGLVKQTLHDNNSIGVYFVNLNPDWLYKLQKCKIQSLSFRNGTLLHSLFALLLRAILSLEIAHNGSM